MTAINRSGLLLRPEVNMQLTSNCMNAHHWMLIFFSHSSLMASGAS